MASSVLKCQFKSGKKVVKPMDFYLVAGSVSATTSFDSSAPQETNNKIDNK